MKLLPSRRGKWSYRTRLREGKLLLGLRFSYCCAAKMSVQDCLIAMEFFVPEYRYQEGEALGPVIQSTIAAVIGNRACAIMHA